MKGEVLANKIASFLKTLSIPNNPSFDANSQFYLCTYKDGTGARSCTVSNLIFEYRFYGDSSSPHAHFGGTDRIIPEENFDFND